MPDSLNILDASGINAVAENTPPVISGFSYDPVYKGDYSVSLKVDSITEDSGSGIKYIEWYCYDPRWGQRQWKKIEYSEPYPTSLTNLSWTFNLFSAVDTDDILKVSLTAVNISAEYLGETSETKSTTGLITITVLGLQSLNIQDASSFTRVSDGVAPVVTNLKITNPEGTALSKGDSQILVKFDIQDESLITLVKSKVTVGTWSEERTVTNISATTAKTLQFTYNKLVGTGEVVTVTITAIDLGGEETIVSDSVTVLGLQSLNIADHIAYYSTVEDLLPPVISTPVLTGAEVGSTSVKVSATVTDDYKLDKVTIRLRIDDGPWQEQLLPGEPQGEKSHTFTVPALQALAKVYYEVKAVDLFPRESTSGILSYEVPSVITEALKDIKLLGETGGIPRVGEQTARVRFTATMDLDKVEIYLGVNQDPIPLSKTLTDLAKGTYTESISLVKTLEVNDLISYYLKAFRGAESHEVTVDRFTVTAGIPREIRSSFRRRIMPIFGGFW
jgi:hypothetical protein